MSNFYSLKNLSHQEIKNLFNNAVSANILDKGDSKTENIDLKSENTPKFNIDTIIDKLSNGDKSALEDLDKAGISYTYTEKTMALRFNLAIMVQTTL